MSRICHFILLCLLAVAIPLQGVAAAAMSHCGVGPAMTAGAMQMDGMQMDDMHGMDMSTETEPDHQVDAKAPSHKGSCSACAACCVVAAPGTPVSLSFGSGPVDVAPASAPRPRVAFLTSGPERPPRDASA